MVPLSLCVIAFLSCWGPWGAFAVSLRSQRHRLERLLEKNGLMEAGKVVAAKPGSEIGGKARQAISSVTEYIVDVHGYGALQPLFRQNLDSLMRANALADRWSSFGQTGAVLSLMNLRYSFRGGYSDEAIAMPVETMRFACDPGHDARATPTAGSTWLGNFSVDPSDSNWDFVLASGMNLKIMLDTARSQLRLEWVGRAGVTTIDLDPVEKNIEQKAGAYHITLPAEKLGLPFEGGDLSGRILLTHVEGAKFDGKMKFTEVKGLILFSRK